MNLPFQNVSVKVKIVTPFVVSTLFMVFIILLVVRFYTVKNQQQVVDGLVQAKMTQINNNIERVGAKALLSVSVSAGIEAVRQAYSTYRETDDLYSSSYIIQEQFDDITAAIEQHTGNQTKIHFHLPGARSFIRCWTDKRGDDLSDFRNTILKVEETKKPVYGIETGRGGFVIRGLSPIFHDDGSYAGSVELLFPISEIFEMTTVSEKENFAAFIDKDLLRIATSLDDADASNIGQQAFQTQDYLFVESRKEDFVNRLLTNEILTAGAESVARFDVDSYVISVFPIRNFDGKSEGVLVYTFDRSAYIKSLDALNLSILGSALLCAILAILVVIFAINQSVVKPLRSMNTTLVDTASQSSSSSYQLAESSNMIADGASRQAAAVEQTSASLEELSSISAITSDRTSRCNELSEESKARILSSNQKIEVLKASVDRVVNATEETQKIVKTIDEIAFQTNLLALNAGVEAARAGEAGTGFAVVAEEVRALAQKSAEAARQTSDLIESSIAGVHEVSSFVQKTEQTLVEVTNYTDQINAKISVIEQSAREQVDGIENVNAAVADIDRVIQSNAASSEQNSAAAQELKSQVATVNEVVQRMRGFVGSTSDRKAYKNNATQ